jgi:hypothetical protein
MNAKTHVYKVSFIEPVNGKTDYIFGSLAAIFDVFSPEQIGCKVTRLWNLKIFEDKPYAGRKCTVSKEPLHRKRQQNPGIIP